MRAGRRPTAMRRLVGLALTRTPPPRDGDASYLAAGTPVYAEKGWPTSCRLLTQSAGAWRVYQAWESNGTPVACSPTPGPVTHTAASPTGAFAGCHVEQLPAGETAGQPDFVAFLIFDDRSYVDGLRGGKDPGHGAVVMHVRCDFGAFSDSLAGSHQSAVQGDGDAAFLAVGTPVYAIKGSSTRCRLTARDTDGWHIYTANGPGCASPAPAATALPSHSQSGVP